MYNIIHKFVHIVQDILISCSPSSSILSLYPKSLRESLHRIFTLLSLIEPLEAGALDSHLYVPCGATDGIREQQLRRQWVIIPLVSCCPCGHSTCLAHVDFLGTQTKAFPSGVKTDVMVIPPKLRRQSLVC
jgi:hypothetical protein